MCAPLKLQTRLGRDILNIPEKNVSEFVRNQFRLLDKKHLKAQRKTQCLPFFNCHGLTFASRRTWIIDTEALFRILEDDGYVEILDENNVAPGDVLIYYGENGDITHSAVIVTAPREELLKIPRVISKWGAYSEVVHYANDCPYANDYLRRKFYRIQ